MIPLSLPENKRTVISVVCVLVIGASLAFIILSLTHRDRRHWNQPRYEALGAQAAQETDRLLAHKGQIIIVDMGEERTKKPYAQIQLRGFQKALRRAGSVKVAALESPPWQAAMGHGNVGFPVEFFSAILSNHPGVDAVVSFLGPPEFSDEQRKELPEKLPKLIVVSGVNPRLKALLRDGVVQVAIVPRFSPFKTEVKPAKSLRDWFDLYYEIVTPETAASLPD